MTSIRRKILLGYGLLALGAAMFALLAAGDLRYLEHRIEEGMIVTAFQENALEMRRHEKNHFLYGGEFELEEALRLSDELRAALATHRAVFAGVMAEDELDRLAQSVHRYHEQMAAYWERPGRTKADAVRGVGQEITLGAERIGERERAALAATVQQSRRVLFIGIGIVALLGIGGGHLLARAAVRPLRQLETELAPIAAGRFAHFPEVSRDREIVSLTAALNRMLDELEARRRQVLQSEKLASLGTLASGVAHELNNPLGNISSSCQILLEELDEADIATLRRWLTDIDGETQRAQRIVRILLDYARRRAFAPVPVALAEVVEQSRLLLKNPLRVATLETRLAPGLAVLADAPRLQQVFINLIKNAVDARAVQVAVGAEPAARDNWPPPSTAHVVGALPPPDRPGVVVWVADDGPGIPAEALDKVFDPFFTTREPGHGVGLGLYIVEEIVQEHGGCVAAESPASGGARFTFWLPAADIERKP